MIRTLTLIVGIGLIPLLAAIVRAEDPPAATEPDKQPETKPEDIAGLLVWMLSDEARNVHGATFSSDAALTAL